MGEEDEGPQEKEEEREREKQAGIVAMEGLAASPRLAKAAGVGEKMSAQQGGKRGTTQARRDKKEREAVRAGCGWEWGEGGEEHLLLFLGTRPFSQHILGRYNSY